MSTKESFNGKKISTIKTSDVKLFLIKLQQDGRGSSTIKMPMTEDVFRCFQAIIEDREKPRYEKMVDGYTRFLFTDKDGLPLVVMHWEHRFNHMVKHTMTFSGFRCEHHSPCLPSYLLRQYGKVGYEPKDTSIPDGAFRYWSDVKYLHASWLGGCSGRAETDGGVGRCQKGTGEGQG